MYLSFLNIAVLWLCYTQVSSRTEMRQNSVYASRSKESFERATPHLSVNKIKIDIVQDSSMSGINDKRLLSAEGGRTTLRSILLSSPISVNEDSNIQPSATPSTIPSLQPAIQPSNDTGVAVPTVQPTFRNASSPTSQPTSQPSMTLPDNSLTQPTSQPSVQPTSSPTVQQTSSPTCQPTSMPSVQPSAVPSTKPTAQPSSQPTVLAFAPSSTPTTQPSSAPTLFEAPSSQPTEIPSSQPSEQPTSLPSQQPVSAPSATPSWQPSARPSSQPTLRPTSQPSRQPTSHPSSSPSDQPSSQPTSSPTAVPSSMPSPAGDMGVTWWYLVTARCDLLAETPIKQHDALGDVIYAFSAGITDHLDKVERESVELTAVEITDSSSSSSDSLPTLRDSDSISNNRNNVESSILQRSLRGVRTIQSLGAVSLRKRHRQASQYSKSYTIETWCPDHSTSTKVYQAMVLFGVDATEILEPLHERGMTEVTNVTVSALTLRTSEVAPPIDPQELSPIRITWIIVGTVLLFAAGVLLMGRVKHCKYFYCSQTCMEDTARSWYNTLADGCMLCLRSVGLVSSDLRLYYGSGFDLTTQDEEADFYGETRSNLPSDNLDIHYGGDHRSLRAKYLEDDEEANQNNNNSLNNARLPPKHGRIRTGLGKLFGKLRGTRSDQSTDHPNSGGYDRAPASSPRGRMSPGRMSPVSGLIEMSERNGREVVSPITVPTRFTSSPHSSPPFGYTNSNNLHAGDTHNALHTHSRHYPGFYDPNEDTIDDLGDFTQVPLKPSARYKNEPVDEYESYVV